MDSPTGQPSIQRFSSFREMLDFEYMTSFFGVIKFIQMVIDLVAFICASAKGDVTGAVASACGWIQFVSMMAFLTSLLIFLLYFFKFSRTCPSSVPMAFSEFVVAAIFTMLYITCGITAASFIMYSKYILENMAAATFFTWIAVMLYGTECISIFITWRQSQEGPYFTRSTDSAA